MHAAIAARVAARSILQTVQLQRYESAAVAEGDPSAAARPAVPPAHLAALQHQVNAALPTRAWRRVLAQVDSAAVSVAGFTVQHGSANGLEVRVLQSHALTRPGGAAQRQLDDALLWLLDSISAANAYPVVGMQVKCALDGQVRLLQLASASRCLLIRVPSQDAVSQFCAAAWAALQSSPGAGLQSPLFSPFFIDRMASRELLKGGADTCAAATSLLRSCAGLVVNGCLNLSWIHTHADGAPMSLQEIASVKQGGDGVQLDAVIGADGAAWAGSHLALVQLVHAAVEAQACYAIAAHQHQLPRAFHIADLPRRWLDKYGEWSAYLRAYQQRVPQRDRTEADVRLLQVAQRYLTLCLQGVEPFNPFAYALVHGCFPSAAAIKQSFPPALPQLQLPGASPSLLVTLDFAVETANHNWWLRDRTETNFYNNFQQDYFAQLDPHQQSAIEAADAGTRIHVVDGAAGSGLTKVGAVAAAIALLRTPSIVMQGMPADVTSAPQQVLCVCDSDASARQLAHFLMLTGLRPKELSLFVEPEFLVQWQQFDFAELRESGITHGHPAAAALPAIRGVVVCSIEMALSGKLPRTILHKRQTLVVDGAESVWLLHAVLLLRQLPHLERLILLGDAALTSARFGGVVEVDSLLSAAHAALRPDAPQQSLLPRPFVPTRSRLVWQHRLPAHLAAVLSAVFYEQDASAFTYGERPLPAALARGEHAVCWVQVPSNSRSPYHAQFSKLVELWNCFAARGFGEESVAVLVWDEAQRSNLCAAVTSMASRVFLPEAFRGQEAKMVLLCLPPPPLAAAMDERARLALACSRASGKLFILGDRNALEEEEIESGEADRSVLAQIADLQDLDLLDFFPQFDFDEALSLAAAVGEAEAGAEGEEGARHGASEQGPVAAAGKHKGQQQMFNAALDAAFPPLSAASASAAVAAAAAFPHRAAAPGGAAPGGAAPAASASASSSSTSALSFPSVALRAEAREFETNYAGEVVSVRSATPTPAPPMPAPVAAAAPTATPAAAAAAPAVFVPSFVRPRHCFAAVESYSWKTMVCTHKTWDVNAAVIGGRETCSGRDCISIHFEFWLKVDKYEFWCILPSGCEGSELIFYDRVNPSSKARVATLEAVVASAYNRRLAKRYSGQVGYLIEERARGVDVVAKYDAAAVEREAEEAEAAFAAAAAAAAAPALPSAAAPATVAASASSSSSSGAKTVVASNVVLIPSSKAVAPAARPASTHDFTVLDNLKWKRLPCSKWWSVERAEESGSKCYRQCEYMHREFWLPDPRDHAAFWFVTPGSRTIYTDSCTEPRRRRHLEEAAAMPINRKNRLLYAKEIAHFFPSLAEAQGVAPGAAAAVPAVAASAADVRALAAAASAANPSGQPDDSFASLSSAAAPVYLTVSRALKAAGQKVPFVFEPVLGDLWRLRPCKVFKPEGGSSMCSDGLICQFVHRHCT